MQFDETLKKVFPFEQFTMYATRFENSSLEPWNISNLDGLVHQGKVLGTGDDENALVSKTIFIYSWKAIDDSSGCMHHLD